MSIALGIVKSGTVSGFYNISLVISFLTDIVYFDRDLFWSDYTGATVIILCTTLQGMIANKDFEKEIIRQKTLIREQKIQRKLTA